MLRSDTVVVHKGGSHKHGRNMNVLIEPRVTAGTGAAFNQNFVRLERVGVAPLLPTTARSQSHSARRTQPRRVEQPGGLPSLLDLIQQPAHAASLQHGASRQRRAITSSGFTGGAWFPQLVRSWLRTAATSSSVSWSANAGMAEA
jgi:hypothetical protein